LVEEAKEVLVDEIEPEEAANVALRRIAQTGEDVPRGGDDQKNERAGQQAHPQEMPELAGEEQVQADGRKRENQSDQALGQNVQRAGSSKPPTRPAGGLVALKGEEKESEGEDEPEADENVRDEEARENERAQSQRGGESSVESGRRSEQPLAE